MKRVVRINENDLIKIVKRVIEEQAKLPFNKSSQAFVKVENGKKYVYFESESQPGKKTKYGPVIADHLKDGERFMAINKNEVLFGKGKEIKKG